MQSDVSFFEFNKIKNDMVGSLEQSTTYSKCNITSKTITNISIAKDNTRKNKRSRSTLSRRCLFKFSFRRRILFFSASSRYSYSSFNFEKNAKATSSNKIL